MLLGIIDAFSDNAPIQGFYMRKFTTYHDTTAYMILILSRQGKGYTGSPMIVLLYTKTLK